MRRTPPLAAALLALAWLPVPRAWAAGDARAMLRIGDAWYWQMMRLGPFPYPNDIRPEIPETLAAGPAVVFQDYFADLTLVLPDRTREIPTDRDAHALDKMAALIWTRARRCRIVHADQFDPAASEHHLAVLGTLENNSFARRLLRRAAPGFMDGLNSPSIKSFVARRRDGRRYPGAKSQANPSIRRDFATQRSADRPRRSRTALC